MPDKASEQSADKLLKLLVIGNSGTGKSCLMHRFVRDVFVDDQTHTIGVEFGSKVVNILGTTVRLQIWDTAGQERYRSVTRSYYRGAAGCLLVYDVTCRQSYEAVPQWLNAARTMASQDIVVMLVGNKADVANDEDLDSTSADGTPQKKRKVTHLEASKLAQEQNLMMLETSAVTGEYVEDAFIKVVKNILIRMQEKEEADTDANGARAVRLGRYDEDGDEDFDGGDERPTRRKTKGVGCCKV